MRKKLTPEILSGGQVTITGVLIGLNNLRRLQSIVDCVPADHQGTDVG